jgi:hypothetical protein
MRQIKLSEIVLDFSLYPRAEVNKQHISYMLEAHTAGTKFPPIVIDKKSKRAIDGFHRHGMYKRALGDEATVEVVEKSYRSEREMFLDAMRMNAAHGRALSTFDRTRCIVLAQQLKMTHAEVASALQITVEKVGELGVMRVGELRSAKRNGPHTSIPIKRTIRHMSGKRLTQAQSDTNDKLGGMEQLFYVNQLTMLIENKLLDVENEGLMKGVVKLHKLLDSVVLATA